MKLFEILATDSGSPYEIGVLIRTFPRAWKKMLHKLISDANPKLTFCNLPIYGPRGFGPAVLDADASIKLTAGEGLISVLVSFFSGSNTEVQECRCDDFELQRVAYDVDGNNPNRLILLYHTTVDSDSLERAFHDAFEKQFGEEFDRNDPQHLSIFNQELATVELYYSQAHFVFAAGLNGSVGNSLIVTNATGRHSATTVNKFFDHMIGSEKYIEL